MMITRGSFVPVFLMAALSCLPVAADEVFPHEMETVASDDVLDSEDASLATSDEDESTVEEEDEEVSSDEDLFSEDLEAALEEANERVIK